ncbi:SMP-30/gluconolactonase/LRE family protein [Gordonia sp. TBRC 11910]|uniref:SMP-30/gluconolactonase/LRE family protein n=1 Tax=Gordonia asplenii TaxID=2725283 RepID=A0A848KVH5_9ACTN|nr:SMP-30/gluconolactonase/LRE family protein [Gordonia asplenii]NMO00191.1 SMP-30/gluconolactonase/LRE family protein [Gordonia asplenii]
MQQQIVASGHGLVESARIRDGEFWFADWFARSIVRLDADGAEHVVGELASMPVCFDWLPDGTLVTTGGGLALTSVSDAGALTRVADLSGLSDKAYNDIAVDPRGNVFVNNVGFDFPGGEFAPGFVGVVGPDGSVRRVAEDLAFPNGMAVTADGSTLIVAESYAARLSAFTIADDGSLTDRRVWANLGEGVAPDGISIDPSGAVWYASVPQQHCALVAEGGDVLAEVPLDRGCFDCAIDGSTLYVATAQWRGEMAGSGQVVRVDVA